MIMVTTAKAIQDVMEQAKGSLTSDEIKKAVQNRYPGQWKPATLQAHLYACVVNNPKAYVHHPYASKFLYKNSDDSFELYSEEKHGPNEWAPAEGEDGEDAAEELVEATISLERDIEDHLINNLEVIEPGLKFVKRQYHTDVGRIDILAKDANETPVVIEVKAGEAKDSAIGQIARYIGWLSQQEGKTPRGFIIASSFPEGVRYAATIIEGVRLLSYRVNFTFEDANI